MEGQTAGRGRINWSPPEYPQGAPSLLMASLPCKQRPGNVKIHCCIFIFYHGSAFSGGHRVPWSLAKPGRRSTRWPECALSSSLGPAFSVLFYHPSSTVTPSVAPEPSHQPACNWIILMSVVILPTYTKASTHKKVLERKDHSAAQSWDAEGSYHCHGRPAWKGGI